MDRRFAIVPEWVIDARIPDTAFRLHAVLLRYSQSSGQRIPGRAALARRLLKNSVDTVDRALKELANAGAVRSEHRHSGKQRLSNLYHVITTHQEAEQHHWTAVAAATRSPPASGWRPEP